MATIKKEDKCGENKSAARSVLSDHLKRHMKKHVDLFSEDPEQICKSILEDVINDIPNKKSSKEETSMYKRKDPHSDGLDEEELEETLAYHDNKYTKKRKLGSKVAKLIKKMDIIQIV